MVVVKFFYKPIFISGNDCVCPAGWNCSRFEVFVDAIHRIYRRVRRVGCIRLFFEIHAVGFVAEKKLPFIAEIAQNTNNITFAFRKNLVVEIGISAIIYDNAITVFVGESAAYALLRFSECSFATISKSHSAQFNQLALPLAHECRVGT